VAPFSGTSGDMEASIAPDNARLFFTSDRTLSGAPPNISRLWYSDRTDTGWAAPLPIEQPLQDLTLLFPSVAQNRNLYLSMTDNVNQWISVSRYIDGSYQEPEKLSDSVNFNSYTGHSFIAPDESYIIFDALDHMSGNNPCRDLYISFRKADSSWSQARSLGDTINTYNGNEVCPFVTRDNRYLFFSRNGHFYWVKAPAFLPKVGIDERSPHDQRIEYMELYPNPASHRVILEYFIPQKEKIRVMLTNSIGTSYLLFEREMNPGHHQLDLDLRNFTPGMWLCSLQSSSSVVSRKLILME
jgi:hypothetical protein